MRLESAIFDMDGTLLDSMGMWNHLGQDLLTSRGLEPKPDFREKMKTMTMTAAAEYIREEYGVTDSVEDLVNAMWTRVEDFYTNEVTLKPGVQKFLALMKMQGVWMYIASSTDRPLVEAALEHTGIRDYFRGILTCSEVGASKKSPDIYEKALTRLHSDKKNTIVFEDMLFAVKTAKEAGFRVAAVYDRYAHADPEEMRRIADYYIESFEEMYQAIE